MALRSLGSSLAAKSNPSSALRQSREDRIAKPNVPEKADPGSLQRELVEEPLERATPEGSDKVVSVNPGVEATSIPSEGLTTPPSVSLLSGNVGQAVPPASGLPGADGQALLQGVQQLSIPRPAPSVPGSPASAPTPTPQVQAQAPSQVTAPKPKGSVLGASTFRPSVNTVGRRSIVLDDPNRGKLRSRQQGFA